MNNRTRSFPYLIDIVATIKVARTQMERHETKFWLGEVTHTMPLRNPTTFRDISVSIE